MLDKLGAEEVKRIAELANAARSARDDILDKIANEDLGEPKPAQGEHNPSARLGLDPLPQDHPARAALEDALGAIPLDAQNELRALTWIGRGDYAGAEWALAVADSSAAADPAIDSLIGQADLHEFLMKGLYELKLV
jgi:hypothetical protein